MGSLEHQLAIATSELKMKFLIAFSAVLAVALAAPANVYSPYLLQDLAYQSVDANEDGHYPSHPDHAHHCHQHARYDAGYGHAHDPKRRHRHGRPEVGSQADRNPGRAEDPAHDLHHASYDAGYDHAHDPKRCHHHGRPEVGSQADRNSGRAEDSAHDLRYAADDVPQRFDV